MYKIIIYYPKELAHFSYVMSGLIDLEKAGLLKYEFAIRSKTKDLGRIDCKEKHYKHDLAPQPKTSFYELIDEKNKIRVKFAIDLNDIGYFFSYRALESNEYVFKRNYVKKYINNLPLKYRKKVKSFGIPFFIYPGYFKGEFNFLIGYVFTKLINNIKVDRSFFVRIYNSLKIASKDVKNYKNQPTIDSFKNDIKKNNKKVFYQKRLFNEVNYNKDVKEINEQRYLFVKRLKETLSDEEFLGGLVPNKIALERYPNFITKLPTSRKLFFNSIKGARVVIYTRGLEKSPGWTLPEYLSLGKAILAEKHETIFPEPLINGKHLIYFDNIDDCIIKLKSLLTDDEKIKSLSQNAIRYFKKYVVPKNKIGQTIKFMLERHGINLNN